MGNFPVGPLAGVAFNLTLLSYCGSLDMGLHLDPAAVAEPALLRTLLLDAFDELIDVASLTPAQRPATTSRPVGQPGDREDPPAKRRAKTAKRAPRSRSRAKGAAKQPAKAKRGKKAPAKSRARAEAS